MGCKWYDLGCKAREAADGLFRQAQQTQKDVGRAIAGIYDAAQRGDPGRFIGSGLQSAYNVAAAPVRAVTTGNFEKEIQRATGSYWNLRSGGAADTIGGSKTIQSALRTQAARRLTAGYSSDLAGAAQGTRSMAREGQISNADRNDLLRFGLKSGVIAGAGLAYAAATAPAAPGAVQVATGPVAAAEPVVQSGVLASASQVTPVAGAAQAGAVAGGSSLGTYLTGASLGSTAYQLATGQKKPGDVIGDFFGGGGDSGSDFWRQLPDFFGGGGSAPAPAMESNPWGNQTAQGFAMPQAQMSAQGPGMGVFLIGGLAVVAVVLAKKRGLI